MNSDPLSQNKNFGTPYFYRSSFKADTYVFALQSLPHLDGKAFSREHIHDRQGAEPSSFCQLVHHEIHTPHFIRSGWPTTLAAMQRGSTPPPWLVSQRQAFFLVQAVHLKRYLAKRFQQPGHKITLEPIEAT